ncbi:MAG: hypothetical protein ABID45_04510 [Patescibacteria group bacterium]
MPKPRVERKIIGEGQEQIVYEYAPNIKTGRERDIVLKEDKHRYRFTSEKKKYLENNFQQRRKQYSYIDEDRREINFFPRQRFFPAKERPGYYLAQEKINLASKPDIFSYSSDELLPQTQKQLQVLIDLMRESLQRFRDEGPTSDNYPIDAYGKENIVVDNNGDIKCVDTGYNLSSYEKMNPGQIRKYIESRIFLLELVAGRDVESLLKDEFYSDLVSRIVRDDRDFRRFSDNPDLLMKMLNV